MSAPHDGRLGRGPALLVLAALAALIALARWHTFDEPLERDITTYAVIGRELVAGRRLYSDLWDHKPPGIYVTYAAAIALFGPGPRAVYALGVGAAVVALLAVYAAGSSTRAGRCGGLWAAAFWAAVASDLDLQANQPNTEVFMNACIALAFALLLRARRSELGLGASAVVGTLLAIATLFKHVTVVHPLLFGLVHWSSQRRERRPRALVEAALFLVPGGLLWAGTTAWFWLDGRLDDFVATVFTFNRFYSRGLAANLLASFAPATLFPAAALVYLPLALLGATLVIAGRLRPRQSRFLIALVVATHLALALPGKFFAHYYQLWLPTLAIAAGLAVASLKVRPGRSGVASVAGVAVLLAIASREVPRYGLSARQWSERKYGAVFVDCERAGRELDALLEPGESFYDLGAESGLYFHARRSPPSGVFLSFAAVQGPLAEPLTRRLISDLERTRPEAVVTWRSPLNPRVAQEAVRWLAERYVPVQEGPWVGEFYLHARRDGALLARLRARR